MQDTVISVSTASLCQYHNKQYTVVIIMQKHLSTLLMFIVYFTMCILQKSIVAKLRSRFPTLCEQEAYSFDMFYRPTVIATAITPET